MTTISTIGPEVLGSRLREARNAARLTQQASADQVGLSRTTLVAIESGDRTVRSSELVQLAACYAVSVSSLLKRNSVSFDVAPLFRRSRTARKDQDLAGEVAKIVRDQACLYVELEERLGKPLQFSYPREITVDANADLAEQAEDIALELRQKLGFGLGPIPDVIGMVEVELGIRVFVQPLPSSISGAFAFSANVGACIIINSLHPRARQNWTFAHELAHFLTERNALDISWHDAPVIGRHYLERFSDLFAGALLMPAATIRRRFNECKEWEGRFSARQLIYLARGFRVSTEAFTRRLEQLGLVPEGTYEALIRRGLGKVIREVFGEYEGAPREASSHLPRFALLAIEAYQQELLSEAQLAEHLCVERIEARKLVDAISEYDALLGSDK